MKLKRYVKPAIIGWFVLSSAVQGYASGGDGTGNGGSPLLLRTKLIKEFINAEVRNDALQFINTLRENPNLIPDGSAKRAFKDMLARDMETDIMSSSYVLRDSCQDVGKQAAGGAVAKELGGDICLSPRALAELNSSKAEIVGLVIHEHAHHYGYNDQDYAIYNAVYQNLNLANPDWDSSSSNGGSAPIAGPQKYFKAGDNFRLNPPYSRPTAPSSLLVVEKNPTGWKIRLSGNSDFTGVGDVLINLNRRIDDMTWEGDYSITAKLQNGTLCSYDLSLSVTFGQFETSNGKSLTNRAVIRGPWPLACALGYCQSPLAGRNIDGNFISDCSQSDLVDWTNWIQLGI